MPALQLYDTLLRFTLFQGMGHDELEQLVAGTRLDFIKLPRAATLLHEGDPVGRLLLLTNGTLRAVTRSADRGYAVAEQIRPPFTIEPERIFGLHQASARTFEATTDANLIAIDKAEVAALCGRFMAFRLNMANMLATQTQRSADSLWLPPAADLAGRIVRFIAERCLTTRGPKEIHIMMERLAYEVNDSRLNVSRALRGLREAGMIKTTRGKITVDALERLTEAQLRNPL